MLNDFMSSILPEKASPKDAWWFIFADYRLFVLNSGAISAIPAVEKPETLGVNIVRSMHLGSYLGRSCYAAEGTMRNEGCAAGTFREIRSLFAELENGFFEIALTALHLLKWDARIQFCSRCRHPLRHCDTMRAKECKACGLIEFPRISPAIIVLIEKGDSVLLARSARFAGGFFSVIAGFVNPGETLEETVRREVMEETGIMIKNIRYFGSQPWPFPDSLMVGFTAEYESGELRIDGEEIVEGNWFKADALPQLPGRISIARQLIDWFINKHLGITP